MAVSLANELTLHSTMSLLKRRTCNFCVSDQFSLHSTMSLLKLHSTGVRCCQRPALHSTMSLLKPSVSYDEHTHGNIFTFHYVSIKTQIMQARWAIRATLHSTMSLLKH